MEGEEFQVPVELLLVYSVGSLHFPVVLRGARADELVLDPPGGAEGLQRVRAPSAPGGLPAALGDRPVGELGPVVGLDEGWLIAEECYRLGQADHGFARGVLCGEVEVALPARLVEVGVLVEPPLKPRGFASLGDVFHVDLPFVAREFGGVVYPVVLLRVGLVSLVSIELFQDP